VPLFDYRCAACGEVFEHLQGLGEPDPARSPCCEAPVERLRSVPADFRGQFSRPACETCCGGEEGSGEPPCGGGHPCCHG
jgi:putative FmdB family regulatory protein